MVYVLLVWHCIAYIVLMCWCAVKKLLTHSLTHTITPEPLEILSRNFEGITILSKGGQWLYRGRQLLISLFLRHRHNLDLPWQQVAMNSPVAHVQVVPRVRRTDNGLDLGVRGW